MKVWRTEQLPPPSPTKGRLELTRGSEGPFSSPSPKTFSGRNCLLGSLVDATFTCVSAISDSRAIVCTEDGDICLLDDTDQRQRLERVAKTTFKVLCICVDVVKGLVVISGEDGKALSISVQRLLNCESFSDSTELLTNPSSNLKICPELSLNTCGSVLAVGFLDNHFIAVDEKHQTLILNIDMSGGYASTGLPKSQIPAHESAVLGISTLVQPNIRKADFMTWSSQGTTLFWTLDGICKDQLIISLEQQVSGRDADVNELKVLRSTKAGEVLLFGDRYGNVGHLGKCTKRSKAHNGDINDIAVAERDDGVALVASCGRDRILQIFQLNDDSLEILQTLEGEHAASVGAFASLFPPHVFSEGLHGHDIATSHWITKLKPAHGKVVEPNKQMLPNTLCLGATKISPLYLLTY